MSDQKILQSGIATDVGTENEIGATMSASVGAQLSAQRQSRGWTVDQVANSLKLAPRQVEAIESDNYSALPPMAVTRGFVRAYAKLLKIDAAPLLASMRGAIEPVVPANRAVSTPFSSARRPPTSRRSSRKLVLALAGVAGIAAVVYVIPQFGTVLPTFKLPGRLTENAEKPATVTQPVSSGLPAAASGEAVTLGAEPAPPAGVAESESNGSGVAGTTGKAGTAGTVPENANAAESPAKSGNNLLQITMKQDSWLEVRRATGNDVLAARLVKAGTVETFEVDSPVKLTVGNAAGVEAILRGEPMKLETGRGGNVARMTVK